MPAAGADPGDSGCSWLARQGRVMGPVGSSAPACPPRRRPVHADWPLAVAITLLITAVLILLAGFAR
jgi:hypothetical protein